VSDPQELVSACQVCSVKEAFDQLNLPVPPLPLPVRESVIEFPSRWISQKQAFIAGKGVDSWTDTLSSTSTSTKPRPEPELGHCSCCTAGTFFRRTLLTLLFGRI